MVLPELDFEAESGGLCGKFTTVEGLLASIKTQVHRIVLTVGSWLLEGIFAADCIFYCSNPIFDY